MQISTSWVGSKDGTVLGRGRYVSLELEGKTGIRKGSLPPYQKPCPHMKDAIVAEGAERGQTAKVCAEATCAVHFADRREPDARELAKQRESRRRELLKRNLEATIRHRILAEVLKKVGAPLERTDLVLVLQALLDKLNPVRKETLARRHKLGATPGQLSTSSKVHAELVRFLQRSDETALAKLLLETVLLDHVEQVSTEEPEYLIRAAKQHRVDTIKVREGVEREFAAKEARQAAKRSQEKPKTTASAKKVTPPKKGSPARPGA